MFVFIVNENVRFAMISELLVLDCEFDNLIHVYLITFILDLNYNSSMSDQVSENLISTTDDKKHMLFDFWVI